MLGLLSLLPRATFKTLSHMSSQYEIMVGIPRHKTDWGKWLTNALFWTRFKLLQLTL